MKKLIILSSLFMFMLSTSAFAQTTKKKVVKTQVKQQKRIHQGVKSGELTKKEVVSLQKQQQRINQTKKRAKADGKVTKKEKTAIRAKQTKASARIAKKKNNMRVRN